MIKRTFLIFTLVSILICFFGCNKNEINNRYSSDETAIEPEKTELNVIAQNELYYIVSTDWMKFYFFKNDFQKSDIPDIVNEIAFVMTDVRNYLDLNYTLKEAEETVCYFDSSYRNEKNEKRSMCFPYEKKMYCVSLDDFVHEYVHMISGNNIDLVYHPDDVFVEGLAQYVSLNFYDGIASKKYIYFKQSEVLKNSNVTEHKAICDLLSKNKISYNAKNYNRAFIAMLDKNYDISNINKKDDFYNYSIGYIFVDFCINKLGGIEKFISVYVDSVIFADVYGKKVDDIILEACDYNTAIFYKN